MLDKQTLNVLMVGSSLKDKGGIVSVMKNILGHPMIKSRVQIDLISTHITGSMVVRIFMFFAGMVHFFYRMLIKRPDVVHIHMSERGSFYRKSIIILLAKTFKVPIIVHMHSSEFKEFYSGLSTGGQKYCRYILDCCDCLIALSKEWERFYSSLIDPSKIKIIYNGIKPTNYIDKTNMNGPVCLFLGRLGVRKGTYDLIEAIRLLKEYEDLKATFIFAGDGELEKTRALIEKYQLESFIDILGWIDGEKKERLLKKSDILILPSYNEGLPMAILESMDYGLSIVTTPVGGIPEVIKEMENGFLIEPGNIKQLSNRIAELVKNSSLRKQILKNNQTKVKEEFNNDLLLNELLDAYYKLANNKKR